MSVSPTLGEISARAREAGARRAARPGPIVLVASNFPPVVGGSAAVYGALATHAGERMVVLAPRRNYIDGRPLEGWRDHDRGASHPVVRRPLLRARLRSGREGRLGRLFAAAKDLGVRLDVVGAVAALAVGRGVRTVCVGELVAGAWLIALLRWVPGLRTVVYVHGEELTTQDGYDRGRRQAERALRQADEVVVVSRFTEQAALALLGPAARAKVRLIPNGVDGRRFRPRDPGETLRRAYGLQGCFVYVSVCRLVEKKGVDNAIRALATVTQSHPDSRLLVVGAGPFEAALRALAQRCGVADQVVFCGAVADARLVDHYCLGDVFVMPNRALANGDTEGFGLVFLEANACGLPVIAGRDGGSTDAVEHGVNGLVVDGASVGEIAAAMIRLRRDPALRERLREGGRRRAAAAAWGARAQVFLEACAGRAPSRTPPQ